MQRAARLRALVYPLMPPIHNRIDRDVAYVTIEASNLWASFARSLFLSCVFSAKQESGPRVKAATTFPSVNAAIAFAATTIKPRGGEPNWGDPGILLILLKTAGVSNIANVRAALSYSTTVFRGLPTMRNFFAHRSEVSVRKTARVARLLGVSVRLRPSEILCSRSPGRPQNIITDWIDDIRNVIQLACQ